MIETREVAALLNATLRPGDTCLFIQSGVYLAVNNRFGELFSSPVSETVNFRALADHVSARGLSDLLAPKIHTIDYTEFVTLSAENDKCITW